MTDIEVKRIICAIKREIKDKVPQPTYRVSEGFVRMSDVEAVIHKYLDPIERRIMDERK